MEEAIFDEVTGTFIGIDFGTSNSVVSYFNKGEFNQVKFKGKSIIPSVLYFESKDKIVYGDRAIKKGVVHPEFMLKEFKRDLGTNKKYTLDFLKDDSNLSEADGDKFIYVIDTNIFIEEPDILDSFNPATTLVKIPLKVIDELQFRKDQADTDISAKFALENIESKKDCSHIETSQSYDDLLSKDLDVDKNSNNDNKILSVAKHFSLNMTTHSTILLTNDSGLIIKSEAEQVSAKKLQQYKNECAYKEHSSTSETLVITPKEAARILLQHIREESEKYIGEDISKTVITVPANFNPVQIGQVKEAGERAGFDEIAIQKEPVAVGYAYSLEEEKDKTILVYDFGGGTFDASLLRVNNGLIEVVAIDGDAKLGGADVTNIVSELIYINFEDEHDTSMFDQKDSGLSNIDYCKNSQAISSAAEQAKIELSYYDSTDISIANLVNSKGDVVNIQFILDIKTFESEISDIRKKSLDVVKNLIGNSGIEKESIDEIVMAGGTSLIPSIRDSLEDTLGIPPKKSIDTSVVISQGAVLEAMRHWSESESVQEKIIYNDNALQDFGIGIKGNRFDLLIAAEIELPVRETREYFTEKDGQESLLIEVFQRKKGYQSATKTFDKGVEYIDKIAISGLPKANVGDLSINVTFELTKDDALEVAVEVTDKSGTVSNQNSLSIVRASDV